MTKKLKKNKYLISAVSSLLIKHMKKRANNTVDDDPELAALKDYLVWKILNNK